jgi:hypothetical protein
LIITSIRAACDADSVPSDAKAKTTRANTKRIILGATMFG